MSDAQCSMSIVWCLLFDVPCCNEELRTNLPSESTGRGTNIAEMKTQLHMTDRPIESYARALSFFLQRPFNESMCITDGNIGTRLWIAISRITYHGNIGAYSILVRPWTSLFLAFLLKLSWSWLHQVQLSVKYPSTHFTNRYNIFTALLACV